MSQRRPLDVIEIQNPCPANWDQMAGDDKRRFCSHCGKFVHDLSQLPADEAEKLVCSAAGSMCVRFSRDPATKQVITLNYIPRPLTTRRRAILTITSIIAAFGISGTLGAIQLLRKRPPPAPAPMMLGEIMVPAPATPPVQPK